jgi:predicted transcriptional regulator
MIMKRGERKPEREWRLLILGYLLDHRNDNNNLQKIAEGIGTTTITATKYLYYYLGLGLVRTQEIVNVTLFHLTETGELELKKLEEG